MGFVFKVMPELLAIEKLRLSDKPSAFLIQKLFNQGYFALFQVISRKNPVSSSSQLPQQLAQSNPYIITVGLTNKGWQIIASDNLENICAITELTNIAPNTLLKMLNEQGFLLEDLLLPNADDADNDPLCTKFYTLPSDTTSNLITLLPSIIPTQLVDGQRLIFGRTERTTIEKMLLGLATSLVKRNSPNLPALWLFRESIRNDGIVAITTIYEGKCVHGLIKPYDYVGNKNLTTEVLLKIATGEIKPFAWMPKENDYSNNNDFHFSLNNLVFPDLSSASAHPMFENIRIVAQNFKEYPAPIGSVPVTYLPNHKIIFSSQPQPEVTKKELQVLTKKISASPDNKERNLWLICSNSLDDKLVIISCNKPPETLNFEFEYGSDKQHSLKINFYRLMHLLKEKNFLLSDMILPLENEATIHKDFKNYIHNARQEFNFSSNLFLFREPINKKVYFATKRVKNYEVDCPIEVEAEIARYQPSLSITTSVNHCQGQLSSSSALAFFQSPKTTRSSQETIPSEFFCPLSGKIMKELLS